MVLLHVIMEQMMCDTDPELGRAVQLMGILRILIDPENMIASINKTEKSDFLNYFYKHSIHILISKLRFLLIQLYLTYWRYELVEKTIFGSPVLNWGLF